jgi:epoxyqueuosine reductase
MGNELKEELRKEAFKLNFSLFGVPQLEKLQKEPFPPGRGIQTPKEALPSVKSIIILGFRIWDEVMNAVACTPIPKTNVAFAGGHEYYNFYYEITMARAWQLAHHLWKKGFTAIANNTIHLKVGAHLAGLGHIGKQTQVITPEFGPRLRWVAILTDAHLDPDQPFKKDLCGDCEICVKSCPFNAILPGTSLGVAPGKKVDMDKCIVSRELEEDFSPYIEKYVRRITPRGFMECTICNLACPIGKETNEKYEHSKRRIKQT